MLLALAVRVYCRADASPSSKAAGDLFDYSSTPGRAMKVTDLLIAFSAVARISVALRARTDLIPVLAAFSFVGPVRVYQDYDLLLWLEAVRTCL